MKTKAIQVLQSVKYCLKATLYNIIQNSQTRASSAFFWCFEAWHENAFLSQGGIFKSIDFLFEYHRIFVGLNLGMFQFTTCSIPGHIDFSVLIKYKKNIQNNEYSSYI